MADQESPQRGPAGSQEVATLLTMHGAVLALSVLTQSILAYTLLPEGRGSYAVCVLFASIAGVLCALGTARGAQYLSMTRQASASESMSIALLCSLIGSAMAIAIALPLIQSNFAFFRKAETSAFYLSLLLIPAISLAFAATLQMEGFRRFRRLAIFSAIKAAAGMIGILLLVAILKLGVNGAILALMASNALMLALCVADLAYNRETTLQLPSIDGIKNTIHYGLREYLAGIGQSLDPKLAGLLLGLVAVPAEIGIFTAGYAAITRVSMVPAAIATYLLPRVAGDGGTRPHIVAFCARVTWWVVGGMLLVWVAVSAQLVPLLLSEAFKPAVRLSWIMCIGLLAYSGSEIFAAYFRGIRAPQIYSYSMWMGLSVNVILFFTLYPHFGLTGAAWALTGDLICRSLFLGVMFHRTARLPMFDALLLRTSDVAYLWRSSIQLARRAMAR